MRTDAFRQPCASRDADGYGAAAQHGRILQACLQLCLEQRRLEWHRSQPRRISAFDQMKELGALKAVAPFLKQVPHHPLQQAAHDLQKVYVNFFEGRADYPKPRRKFRHESFRYPDPKQFRIKGSGHKARIFLPKAGWVHTAMHREIVGDVKNVTVSREGEWWFASEIAETPMKIGEAVGVDLGVVKAMALSDGAEIAMPRISDKEQCRRCLCSVSPPSVYSAAML